MATLIEKDRSGVYKVQSDETELVLDRTRTFKKFRCSAAPDGRPRFRVAGQISPIHYHLDPFNNTEEYKEIDLDVVLTPGENWDAACETNGYQTRIWQSRVVNGKTIRYIAQFRRAGKWLSMAPIALLWRNSAGEKQLISKTQAVGAPVVDNEKYRVTWENAFGPGLDFRYNLRPDEFFKTLVIHNKSDLPVPTIGTAGLKLFLIMALAWHPDSKASNDFAVNLEPDEFEDVTDMDDFDEESNDPRFSFKDELLRDTFWVRTPRAWDSFLVNGRPRPHTIDVDWSLRRKGNFVFALLSIPATTLNNPATTYPVFMDVAIGEELIGAGSDDAQNAGEVHPGDGAYDHAHAFYIWLGADTPAWFYIGGFRFTTIPVHKGVTIDAAAISFWPDYDQTNDLDVNIAAEDVDNAATFAANTHEPYDAYLAKTTAVYNWNCGVTKWTGWADWIGGAGKVTPNDVSAVVQEIVDRGGWATNNAIAFVIWNVKAVDPLAAEDRTVCDYEYDGVAPKLNITYTGIAHALTATAAVISSTTASLTRGRVESMTATSAVSSTTTAALTRGKVESLTATAEIISSTQAHLVVEKSLSATAAAVSSTEGSLVVVWSLSGTASVASSTQGALTRGKVEVLTATAAVVSVVTAQLLLLSTNPADLLWHLLITYGGLDNIQTSANVDIDYDVWEQYRIDCADLSFALEAKLTGALSIGGILEKVAYLTKSSIFVRGDGKFVFYRFVPPPTIHYTFNDDNTHNTRVEQITRETLNDVTCYYGYDPDTGNWAGSVTAEDATSQLAFGVVPRVEEDTTVWHATSASAQEFCSRLVERYKDPREYCSFDTGLMGLVLEPEDIFSNSIAFHDYVLATFATTKVETDLNSGKAKVEALNVSRFTLGGFRVGDGYWGLLDESYNPLY